MPVTHFSTAFSHASEPRTGSIAEVTLACSAIIGAICGALVGTSIAGAGFNEIARVLTTTFAVVIGSVIGGTVGHFLVLPACATLFTRHRTAQHD